jgi:hypothetical protein
MPYLCKHCGKEHTTQEELDKIKERGNEGQPSPEPLPQKKLILKKTKKI